MKSLNKWILWGLLAVFTIVLFEGGLSYFGNHSYYGDMFSWKNFWLILSALASATLPLYYLYTTQKPQFWQILWRIAISLGTFSILHELISGTLISFFAPILLLWNTALLLGVGILILFAMFRIANYSYFKTLLSHRTQRNSFKLVSWVSGISCCNANFDGILNFLLANLVDHLNCMLNSCSKRKISSKHPSGECKSVSCNASYPNPQKKHLDLDDFISMIPSLFLLWI